LIAKRICFNHRKYKGDVGKFTTGNHKLRKHRYAFCKEGHWKTDHPRLKKEKGQKSEANFARADDGADSDSSVFSSINPIVYYSEESE